MIELFEVSPNIEISQNMHMELTVPKTPIRNSIREDHTRKNSVAEDLISVVYNKQLRGRLLAVGSAVSFSLMNFSAKNMGNMNGLTILFIRSTFGLVFAYAYIRYYKLDFWPRNSITLNTHLMRMVFGGFGLVFATIGIKMLPLQISAVILTLEIPITNILSKVIYQKKTMNGFWILIGMGLVGEILVINPSILGIGEPTYTSDQVSSIGIMLTVFASFLYTVDWMMLAERQSQAYENVILYSISGMFFTAFLSITTKEGLNFDFSTVSIGLFSFIQGAAGLSCSVFLSLAVIDEPNVGIITSIFGVNILISFAIQVALMGTAFSWYSLSGSILVILAVMAIITGAKQH